MTEEIIALDLETTGLNPRTDQILELGAARIRNGRVEDTYAAFINIGKKIPEFIVGLTGITDEMAEGGLPLGEALDGFLDFCGEAPILGHNILFDYRPMPAGTLTGKASIRWLLQRNFCRSFPAVRWKLSACTMESARRRNIGLMRMHFLPITSMNV